MRKNKFLLSVGEKEKRKKERNEYTVERPFFLNVINFPQFPRILKSACFHRAYGSVQRELLAIYSKYLNRFNYSVTQKLRTSFRDYIVRYNDF